MRIHSQTSLNAINPYSAAAEKAVAAQRAAQTRKKLLKASCAAESDLKPDEAFLVAEWMSTRRREQ